MELTGIINHLSDVITSKDGKYTHKEIILELPDEKYPQYPTIVFKGKAQDAVNSLHIGDEVKIQINIRGSRYDDKTTGAKKSFTEISGWKIEVLTSAQPVPQTQSVKDFVNQPNAHDSDLLPF
jgi:Domain of unknown function (DUF3127)